MSDFDTRGSKSVQSGTQKFAAANFFRKMNNSLPAYQLGASFQGGRAFFKPLDMDD